MCVCTCESVCACARVYTRALWMGQFVWGGVLFFKHLSTSHLFSCVYIFKKYISHFSVPTIGQ